MNRIEKQVPKELSDRCFAEELPLDRKFSFVLPTALAEPADSLVQCRVLRLESGEDGFRIGRCRLCCPVNLPAVDKAAARFGFTR
jgi:hypothetical protein